MKTIQFIALVVAAATTLDPLPTSAQHTAADKDRLLECGAAFAVTAQQSEAGGDVVRGEMASLFSARMFTNADALLAAEGQTTAQRQEIQQTNLAAMQKLMSTGATPTFSREECMALMIVDNPQMSPTSDQHMKCGSWFTLRSEFERGLGDVASADSHQAMATMLLERSAMLLMADGYATDSLRAVGETETAQLGLDLLTGSTMPYSDEECRTLAGG